MITRRQALTTGAVIATGAAGAALGLVRPIRHHRAAVVEPPAGLSSALAREHDLMAALRTAMQHDPALKARLGQVYDDHSAHAIALKSAVNAFSADAPASPTSSPPSSLTPATSASLQQLRAAELTAARLAAAESATLAGANAALLASISACESTHAELLA